ncbi:Very-short-patch-repair endonuclease [Microlunatus soli]|uniref:Very-short-patch-repair endonuclease n=1 Tax=Microlunatus soli TaxID=630515 RepID=A0A1H1VP57_9ACTN|nr:Very-short-patch-repair endonuclease [Microlunatus soli]
MATVLRDNGGLISTRSHPELRGSVHWLAQTGTLRPILPGVYTDAPAPVAPEVRIAAAACWLPDGVFTGAAAARLSFWPDIRLGEISMAHPTGRRARKGYRVERRTIPPEWVVHRDKLAITIPTLTAIDLVRATGDAEVIDVALRTRATDLRRLRAVFAALPHRRGNDLCGQLIEDSRDIPWSPPERVLHRLLRAAGITGWVANQQASIGTETYAADLRFDRLKLAIEVDGFDPHTQREVFENDRRRGNAFALDGWTVLHFTPRQIYDEPDRVLAQIRSAITMLTR